MAPEFIIVYIVGSFLGLAVIWECGRYLCRRRLEKKKQSLAPLGYRERLGRATWGYMHTLVESLPIYMSPDDAAEVAATLKSVAQAYPCFECRAHFIEYLAAHPVPVNKSKRGLIEYVFNLHNAVNQKLGKPSMSKEEYPPLAHADSEFRCAECLPPPYSSV
jgi:hypothetical protein